MEELHIANNLLSGRIPTELGNLTNMKRLFLADNQLTGSIPSTLSNLSKLQDLFLEYNQLTGSIPRELGSLANLQRVSLINNQLSGCVPASWSYITTPNFGGLPFCEVLSGTPSPLISTFTPSGSGTWSDPFIISNPISVTAHSILSYVSSLSARETVRFQWNVNEKAGSWTISIDSSPDGHDFDLYVRDDRTNNLDDMSVDESTGDESVTVTVQADGHIYLIVRNTDGSAPTDLTLTIAPPS